MTFNYLNGIKTIENLKRMYRHFVMILHPDCGGSNEAMAELNKEYEYWLHKVGNIHESTKADGPETYTVDGDIVDDGFRDIINAIAGLLRKGILIAELCGSWIWISGDSRPYKETLKALGFKWSGNKKMWYWHNPNEKRKFYKKAKTIEEIRAYYGSKRLKADDEKIAIKAANQPLFFLLVLFVK